MPRSRTAALRAAECRAEWTRWIIPKTRLEAEWLRVTDVTDSRSIRRPPVSGALLRGSFLSWLHADDAVVFQNGEMHFLDTSAASGAQRCVQFVVLQFFALHVLSEQFAVVN